MYKFLVNRIVEVCWSYSAGMLGVEVDADAKDVFRGIKGGLDLEDMLEDVDEGDFRAYCEKTYDWFDEKPLREFCEKEFDWFDDKVK